MRTIKFRGKSIDNGEWVYGDLIHREGVPKSITAIQIGKSGVHEDTVGQFTGMLDKNGKEIYEGDILYAKDGDIEIYNEIGLKDGCFGYIGENSGELLPFCYYAVDEEISGNIYDNPELMTKK